MIVPISLASTVLFCSWSNTSNASKTFFWTSGLRLSEEWEDDWDWRLDTIRLRIIFAFRPCYFLLLYSFFWKFKNLKNNKNLQRLSTTKFGWKLIKQTNIKVIIQQKTFLSNFFFYIYVMNFWFCTQRKLSNMRFHAC